MTLVSEPREFPGTLFTLRGLFICIGLIGLYFAMQAWLQNVIMSGLCFSASSHRKSLAEIEANMTLFFPIVEFWWPRIFVSWPEERPCLLANLQSALIYEKLRCNYFAGLR